MTGYFKGQVGEIRNSQNIDPYAILEAMQTFRVLLTALLISTLSNSLAQDPMTAESGAAQPDNSLRVTLESTYETWRRSIDTNDLSLWEQSTAFSRQIETRNRIVSQKMPFPKALFDDPIGAPPLAGLISLGVLSTGDTATSTYFGKINLGEGDGGSIPDNLLVLHFLKEEGRWLFDNLRIVKIGNDGELLFQIRNRDFSFLRGEEFQPAKVLPPIPQPIENPDFVAEAWIDATGYEVTLTVNGRLTGTFKNLKTTELVIGGLRKGENTVKLDIQSAKASSGGTPKVEIAIYAAPSSKDPAQRVYHYSPGANVPPTISETFATGQ